MRSADGRQLALPIRLRRFHGRALAHLTRFEELALEIAYLRDIIAIFEIVIPAPRLLESLVVLAQIIGPVVEKLGIVWRKQQMAAILVRKRRRGR